MSESESGHGRFEARTLDLKRRLWTVLAVCCTQNYTVLTTLTTTQKQGGCPREIPPSLDFPRLSFISVTCPRFNCQGFVLDLIFSDLSMEICTMYS